MVSVKLREPRVSGQDAEVLSNVRFFPVTLVKTVVTDTVLEPERVKLEFVVPSAGSALNAPVLISSMFD